MGRTPGYRHKWRPTNPYRKDNGDVRVVVYMDDETYREIDAAARQNDCSLSSQMVCFMEIGMETVAIDNQRHDDD